MVGRAGRSKGCTTCRRRRVRCDQAKPTCYNCKRLELECGGYRETTFINEGVKEVLPLRERSSSKSSAQSIGSVFESIPDKENTGQDLGSLLEQRTDATLLPYVPPPKDWTIEIFTLRTLFRGERRESGFWLPLAISQTAEGALAYKCFSALAQVAFGRANQCRSLEASGARDYGNVLVKLNAKLRDPMLACAVDTMASVAILGVYECLASPSGYGWQQHQTGMANIFRIRGPYKHQSMIERQMLEHARFPIICASLSSRKKCFLQDQDWKTIPWAHVNKTEMQHLLDIMADVPGIFEIIDSVRGEDDKTTRSVICEVLLDQTLELQQRSREWIRVWKQSHPDAVRRRRREVKECSLDELLLPPPPVDAAFQLDFSSLLHANHFTIYHMLRILLNETIVSLYDMEPNIPAFESTIDPAAAIAEVDNSVNCIIASVPYHIAPPEKDPDYHSSNDNMHAPSMGAYFMIAPLRTARFPATEEHRRWLDTVLEHLAEITNIKEAGSDCFRKGVIGWRMAVNKPWEKPNMKHVKYPNRPAEAVKFFGAIRLWELCCQSDRWVTDDPWRNWTKKF